MATREITRLLRRWSEGSRDAESELFRVVMPDLRRLAQYFMKGERNAHPLQATELVDQIYLRLVAAKDRDWQNRRHFFAIAARAMRRHLIDCARARPKAQFVAFDAIEGALGASSSKLQLALEVDALLDELNRTQPELCAIVEAKFFLGLSDDEAAEALGLKLRTMQRKWQDARRWLFARVTPRDV
jgi:RNA polymerase sigma factor (TIGR02999 family)